MSCEMFRDSVIAPRLAALALALSAVGIGFLPLPIFAPVFAQAPTRAFPKPLLTYPTPIDPDDIGGVVTSLEGAEAGVWVIADSEPPARLVRIVVTDDDGRYLLPDLPKAAYQVFVRGHGLDDSKASKAWPGQQLFFGVARSAAPDRIRTRPAGVDRSVVITLWDEGASPAVPGTPPDDTDSAGASCTIPYPTEAVASALAERVDDPAAGWKGRGFWGRAQGKVVRCQRRPNPLAR
jgi:hypothetical protein